MNWPDVDESRCQKNKDEGIAEKQREKKREREKEREIEKERKREREKESKILTTQKLKGNCESA